MPASRTARWIAAWAGLSAGIAGVLAWALLGSQPSSLRRLFTPGAMTHGHHSIELACGACHRDAFGGGAVLQNACVDCHAEELRRADDSHPKSKFTDPRNADLVARLDARLCAACHAEHRPQIVGPMGVTLPQDFCVTCHADIGEERDTHAGLGFETCASGGCHNFHDNRALYEDFLLAHAGEPALGATPVLPARDFGRRWKEQHPGPAAMTPDRAADAAIQRDWLETAHATAGVNCSGCHAVSGKPWSDRLDHQACAGCHETEVQGFLTGKHGMRLPQGLSPMRPALARLPMQAQAAGHELGCTSCHAAHRFDTREAAVDACLGCHADPHSLAYRESKHFQLWRREIAGELPPGSGVSCASCHLPREGEGGRHIDVAHNPNDTLRPNEKMLRPVCLQCHGLGFALDALADPAAIATNFQHPPARLVESIGMALRRQEADRARRAGESSAGRPH